MSGPDWSLVNGVITYEVALYASSLSFSRMLGQFVASGSFLAVKWASLETMISLEAPAGIDGLMR